MSKQVSVLLFIMITVSASAQQSTRGVAYYAGISVNYTGERSPDFSLPVGFGLSTSLTLLKPDRFKPMIEMTAVGFPEFVISLTNSRGTNDNSYAYVQASLFAGSSVRILKPLH